MKQRANTEPLKTSPLVSLRHVSAGYGNGPAVLADLSLDILAGEHLALLGANGSGKSTLLRLLQGELRPRPEAAPSAAGKAASVLWFFEGVADASALSALEHARLVSPGQQRKYVRQGWKLTGEEILLSGLENAAMIHGEMSAAHYRRATALAGAAGASPLLSMTAPAMSQGQLRLTLILRALMSRPALLLLDEPFDGLDAPARQAVTRALRLAADKGATLVLSAHRQQDIPSLVRRILLVRNGKVEPAQAGNAPNAVFDAAVPPRTQSRFDTAEDCKTDKALRARPLNAFARRLYGCGKKSEGGARPALLELEHVDVFVDRVQVLFDINWKVDPGQQWLISGANGAGKSTLLRLLYGEEFAAFGGVISWRGRPRPGLEALRGGVGYVSDRLQDRYDYDIRALDVVVSGLTGAIGLYHEADKAELALARQWLRRLAVDHLAEKPLHSLSSGNARRVLLARALAGAPPVLLLDEPCSGLDKDGRRLFLDALPVLAAQGVHMLYVSHHQEDIPPLFRHELRLEAGRIASAGARD
ncbi:MAG: ATP-binding cassette domain-containing protein [Desulfovibrio sp.]|jgi:molybdate transport system ATP-binding protein|nr:ATP-binding cassette domain-containing protein [Desulfovibrio sp.]